MKLLKNQKNQAEFFFNKAFLFYKEGVTEEAMHLYKCCLNLNPNHPGALFFYSLLLVETNESAKALPLLNKLIKIDPNVDNVNNRGLAYFSLGDYLNALNDFRCASSLKFNSNSLFNEALALEKLKLIDEAIFVLNQLISQEPSHYEALNFLGAIYSELNQPIRANDYFDTALSISPNFIDSIFNKALLCHKLCLYLEAVKLFEKIIILEPNNKSAWNGLGASLLENKSFDRALICFTEAIKNDANFFEAYLNRGKVFHEMSRFSDAIESFEMSLHLIKDSSEAYFCKGNSLYSMGETVQASECYLQSIAIDPSNYYSRWALILSQIPIVAFNENEIEQIHKNLAKNLLEFKSYLKDNDLSDAYKLVGSIQPFYLAYKELNNKNFYEEYGQICVDLMHEQQAICNKSSKIRAISGKKIRIAIVSGHIFNHSVWHAITKGWLLNLSKDEFEISIFYTGYIEDEETLVARENCFKFFNNAGPLLSWAQSIQSTEPNFILYPELGMDKTTFQLACIRLAGIQMCSWGHPETSGLPTIDYFISADLMEAANSQKFYTEKLIKLPNLGTFIESHNVKTNFIDLSNYGINERNPIIICPGAPFKYSPIHDHIFISIIHKIPNVQFIFFGDNPLSHLLSSRLELKVKSAGKNYRDNFFNVKWLPRESFYGLMQRATLFLDTLGFSGFNTAIQAIECDLPVITKNTPFMRGRLASGILERMELTYLIADSDANYADLAIRIINDEQFREKIITSIKLNKKNLYQDKEPIHALKNLLINLQSVI